MTGQANAQSVPVRRAVADAAQVIFSNGGYTYDALIVERGGEEQRGKRWTYKEMLRNTVICQRLSHLRSGSPVTPVGKQDAENRNTSPRPPLPFVARRGGAEAL